MENQIIPTQWSQAERPRSSGMSCWSWALCGPPSSTFSPPAKGWAEGGNKDWFSGGLDFLCQGTALTLNVVLTWFSLSLMDWRLAACFSSSFCWNLPVFSVIFKKNKLTPLRSQFYKQGLWTAQAQPRRPGLVQQPRFRDTARAWQVSAHSMGDRHTVTGIHVLRQREAEVCMDRQPRTQKHTDIWTDAYGHTQTRRDTDTVWMDTQSQDTRGDGYRQLDTDTNTHGHTYTHEHRQRQIWTGRLGETSRHTNTIRDRDRQTWMEQTHKNTWTQMNTLTWRQTHGHMLMERHGQRLTQTPMDPEGHGHGDTLKDTAREGQEHLWTHSHRYLDTHGQRQMDAQTHTWKHKY